MYVHLSKQHISGQMVGHKDCMVHVTRGKYDISFLKYIFEGSYSRVAKNNFTKGNAVQDTSLTDSTRQLLENNHPQNTILLNLMLRCFYHLQI